MSLHGDLFAIAGDPPSRRWPADLAATLDDLIDESEIYVGRRRQKVSRQDLDVWVQPVDGVEDGRGSQDLARHVYDVHLRVTSNGGPDGAGTAQAEAIKALMRALVERYHGQRPAALGAVEDLVTIEAAERAVDDDPEQARVLDGVVRVTFFIAAGCDAARGVH